MNERRFAQVDVFSPVPFAGNPVAVVVDGDGLSDAEMQRFATWTNLSETTFLLPPTTAEADYRVRIFTTDGELPFAGHPTIGSAHAWLEAGGTPRTPGRLVQECAQGLVPLRESGGRWAFAGPELTRYEPPSDDELERATRGLGLSAEDVLDASWLVNGPEWLALRVASADVVLAIRPDYAALGDLFVGVVGPHPADDGAPGGDDRPTFEVRAVMGTGTEDPVTGSLNAGLARWLRDTGVAPAAYVAAQGTVQGRSGRVHVTEDDGEIWVAGDAATGVAGTVAL
ncbi:PhzF family phenazine biosynthesis protein [Georgenia sp. EYE_87]|uniref:PhzF family phenazine biosynthesis protein n=1 Tax=Georgenia sp. EYE_87 TaxID=2853448 RepID=UPI0020059F11|nr:PhzF family phenazine biosynthesis protein [Georgenia sp. EYE_87]MCK6212735.1 PhzF family phenazine biosynthesis protein [Georgenia sp. EYE_87]